VKVSYSDTLGAHLTFVPKERALGYRSHTFKRNLQVYPTKPSLNKLPEDNDSDGGGPFCGTAQILILIAIAHLFQMIQVALCLRKGRAGITSPLLDPMRAAFH
jgi:hypothetical protein